MQGFPPSYGFLGRHDAYLQNVRALERQPLITLDGVDMIEYDAEEYAEGYSRHLTAVLRRDPDVVMVDPLMKTRPPSERCSKPMSHR